ncbi:MAG: hypothetical protein ABSB74_19990 [Tepidisphaeraceae bacterium]
MPPSAYDFSVRESLQNNRKLGLTLAAILFLCAAGISSYYLWPRGVRVDPTVDFYSDDDGQTYFKDSVYKFAPFDHEGRTAVGAMVAESGGRYFVAYLMRFTPEAQKQLQEKYDYAVKNNLSVQQTVLDFMGNPAISVEGMEIKLPGSGHEWVPRSELRKMEVKAPDGSLPDRYVTP